MELNPAAVWHPILEGYKPSLSLRVAGASSPYDVNVRLGRGTDLEEALRKNIEDVYWENMDELVKPTSLYSPPKDKHLELFDPEQYYLLLRPPSEPTVLLAYVALRMCKEDTKESLDTGDEGKQVDVLYIYELQTVKGNQGQGLGSALLEKTMTIAEKMGVCKVVLTCLKRNVPALRFYKKHGQVDLEQDLLIQARQADNVSTLSLEFSFKPDEIDPTYSYRLSLFTRLLQRQRNTKGGVKNKSALLKEVDKDWVEGDLEGREDADYRILSRKVERKAETSSSS